MTTPTPYDPLRIHTDPVYAAQCRRRAEAYLAAMFPPISNDATAFGDRTNGHDRALMRNRLTRLGKEIPDDLKPGAIGLGRYCHSTDPVPYAERSRAAGGYGWLPGKGAQPGNKTGRAVQKIEVPEGEDVPGVTTKRAKRV